MRAAVFHKAQDLRVQDVTEPSPGPGQVKLRNAFSGICGSDLHMYFAPESTGLDFSRPHPLTGSELPQILGHEFSGTVVELGEGVSTVSVGDRVAVYPIYACGTCAACRRGAQNACRTIGFHGLSSHGGGMAEFTTVDAAKLHVLPENVSLELGALVEPMAVAWHAVERSRVAAGQTALIVGAGPIGIGLWFALRAHGVETIVVSEPSAGRRAAIEKVGATHAVDPTAQDLAAAVSSATGGDGVDVAFDAAGVGPALSSALASLAPHGRAVVVAIHERPMEFAPTSLVMPETSIEGTLAYLPQDFDAVIAAMAAGVYDTTGWVDVVPLADVERTILDLRAGKGMKALVAAQ